VTTGLVTVVIPTFQEVGAIGECLQRVGRQSHADLQVLVADGGSTDGTRAVVEAVAAVDERVRLIDNPRRMQSAGLNESLAEAKGEVVVRLDARSFVDDDYVARCVALLDATGAAVVGGRMVARPAAGAVARGIALANGAWWGAGPARFHADGVAGPAETVYLGSFQRSWLEAVGGWAEDVGVNEDYELNHRIRAAGGVVWLDPGLAVGYRPRATFAALARQYFRYGRSKAATARRHPGSVRLRQAVPAGLVVVGAAGLLPGRVGRAARAATVGHAVLVAGLGAASPGAPAERAAAGLAAWIMHWCWSAGAWHGAVRPMAAAGANR
jgi:succinoglycan biosynthesis protein ExoA